MLALAISTINPAIAMTTSRALETPPVVRTPREPSTRNKCDLVRNASAEPLRGVSHLVQSRRGSSAKGDRSRPAPDREGVKSATVQ